MKYISEIAAFSEYAAMNQLSTGQIALWYALMHINNKCNWIEWFTIANSTLQFYTGLSPRGVHDARNILKQKGLIDYISLGKGKSGKYKIIPRCENITYAHIADVTAVPTADVIADVTAVPTAEGTATIDRQDKSRHRQDNYNNTVKFKKNDSGCGSSGKLELLCDKDFKTIAKAYEENIGTLGGMVGQQIENWLSDTSVDVVMYAIEQTAMNNKHSASYVNGIINNLLAEEVKTKQDLERYKQNQEARKNRGGQSFDEDKPKFYEPPSIGEI